MARAKPQRDERQVGNDDEGHPVACHEHTARNIDTDLRSRTSSGPAGIVPRNQAGHDDRKPPSRSKRREKTLANPGRPHMARRGFAAGRVPAATACDVGGVAECGGAFGAAAFCGGTAATGLVLLCHKRNRVAGRRGVD